MSDIIHLLPDSVANQIAAGEVIQRPASAVKEILENAIDSGADKIELVIKDAGKTLIQITDNGCGMSETDARLSFERHATSKISSVNDLFSIRTMGFRGEALASIAAIAQVEMRTRKVEQELGSHVIIEASEVKSQEFCQCPAGTTLMIKNLFFNVPARRKFLKSDAVEMRNIIEEFQRVALAHPELSFNLYNDRKPVFQLKSSTLKQRVVNIFSPGYNQRLVPVEQQLSFISVAGFVGKPEFARKQRGEQYFFVNKRFIRHAYLNHAVESAFDELLPEKSYPSYFLFIEIDPSNIDINIHPTKTEIKFEDEKMVYSVIRSAVKAALGKFSITPAIDFDVESLFDFKTPSQDALAKPPTIKINPDYNPFESNKTAVTPRQQSNQDNWQKLYPEKSYRPATAPGKEAQFAGKLIDDELHQTTETISEGVFLQLHRRFIITQVKSGLMVMDQQRAHERILFERYLELLSKRVALTQQELFGIRLPLSPADAELMNEIMDDLNLLGFNIKPDTKKPFQFIIEGTPAGEKIINVAETIDSIIEHYKNNLIELGSDKRVNLARSMAKNLSLKTGKSLQQAEMKMLTEELFACKVPEVSIDGGPIVKMINIGEVFDRNSTRQNEQN
ncbi:MAG: DNA mismatch repair endonuclease MutL [Bacteroidales bacterium]|nr:DNA mismatch repair endonuclease MutL [Bacteroidales bacterium]